MTAYAFPHRFFLSTLTLSIVALSGCATSAGDAAVSGDDANITSGLPAFVCDDHVHAERSGPSGQVVATRASGHDGFDRFVIEFADAGEGIPAYDVTLQHSASFPRGESNETIDLPGQAGLSVDLHGSAMFDFSGGGHGFTGASRYPVPDARIMTEAAAAEDFEAEVRWGVGLQRAACFRVLRLASPPRLVVDVQNDGPAR